MREILFFITLLFAYWPVWAGDNGFCGQQLTLDFGNTLVREKNLIRDEKLRSTRKEQWIQASRSEGYVVLWGRQTLEQIVRNHPFKKIRFIDSTSKDFLALVEGRVSELAATSKGLRVKLQHDKDTVEIELGARDVFMVHHPHGSARLLFE